jgi:putative ABC transport system permease protein
VILTVFKIFGFIALIAAAIGIINTLFIAVQERTREIGLDKALGMSSGKVFMSFTIEAISLGFWGSVFGIIVSIIIGNIVNTAFHAEGAFLESFPTFNLVIYTIPDIISVTLLIMFIAFLAGTLPARRAAHKNPIDSLRYE